MQIIENPINKKKVKELSLLATPGEIIVILEIIEVNRNEIDQKNLMHSENTQIQECTVLINSENAKLSDLKYLIKQFLRTSLLYFK